MFLEKQFMLKNNASAQGIVGAVIAVAVGNGAIA